MSQSSGYEEKTYGALIQKASRILMDAGIENNIAEARHLMMHITGKDLASIYACLNERLDDVSAKRYMKAIKLRTTYYPFQYIVGFTYFMDYKFICREKVLIPRYDTETLVIHALDRSVNRNMKVLDMCTGSGCIGISYQLERSKDGYKDNVTLVDISEDALKLAKDNAEALKSEVEIIQSDLFKCFRDENGETSARFDMILSNPPYIRTNDINFLMKDVRDYEPRLALDGSRDGLSFYRRIIDEAPDFLVNDGVLILEIGNDQYNDVFNLLRKKGFESIHRLNDMNDMNRVVSAVWPG